MASPDTAKFQTAKKDVTDISGLVGEDQTDEQNADPTSMGIIKLAAVDQGKSPSQSQSQRSSGSKKRTPKQSPGQFRRLSMDEPEAVNEFMHDVEDKVVAGRKTAY